MAFEKLQQKKAEAVKQLLEDPSEFGLEGSCPAVLHSPSRLLTCATLDSGMCNILHCNKHCQGFDVPSTSSSAPKIRTSWGSNASEASAKIKPKPKGKTEAKNLLVQVSVARRATLKDFNDAQRALTAGIRDANKCTAEADPLSPCGTLQAWIPNPDQTVKPPGQPGQAVKFYKDLDAPAAKNDSALQLVITRRAIVSQMHGSHDSHGLWSLVMLCSCAVVLLFRFRDERSWHPRCRSCCRMGRR